MDRLQERIEAIYPQMKHDNGDLPGVVLAANSNNDMYIHSWDERIAGRPKPTDAQLRAVTFAPPPPPTDDEKMGKVKVDNQQSVINAIALRLSTEWNNMPGPKKERLQAILDKAGAKIKPALD